MSSAVGITGYVFWCLSTRDYSYENLFQLSIDRRQWKLYNKHNLDIKQYFELKENLNKLTNFEKLLCSNKKRSNEI